MNLLVTTLFSSIFFTSLSHAGILSDFKQEADFVCRMMIAVQGERASDLPEVLPKVLTALRDEVRLDGTVKLRVVVGLGNAGEGHHSHRHNLGFRALDHLLKGRHPWGSFNVVPKAGWIERLTRVYDDGHSVTEDVPVFTEKETFRTAKGEVFFRSVPGSNTIAIYARHLHDINESGEFVGPLCEYMGIPAQDVIVLYDDTDIKPGVIKLRQGASSERHKGLVSLTQTFGTGDYVRVKLGIGRPAPGIEINDHVLGNLSPDEEVLFQTSLEPLVETMEILLGTGDLPRAGNRLAQKPK